MKQLSWLSGKRGLMVHYLPEFPGNEQVDSFDLAGFLDDFDRSASDYLIFTLGQNRGFYCAPNEVIDRYAGPGRCSRRDLFGEIAAALAKRGKRVIAYLPCEIRGNTALHAGFRLELRGRYRPALFSGALERSDPVLEPPVRGVDFWVVVRRLLRLELFSSRSAGLPALPAGGAGG